MSRILLVDDDDAFRAMVHETLARDGHEVREAPDGGRALEVYRQWPSDLIITDMFMPVKDGMETIAEFRRLNRAVKIIAVSGGGNVLPDANLKIAKALGA